ERSAEKTTREDPQGSRPGQPLAVQPFQAIRWSRLPNRGTYLVAGESVSMDLGPEACPYPCPRRVRSLPVDGRYRYRQVRSDSTASDRTDRKSTRLNSSHVAISYAVFCLKKKKQKTKKTVLNT